MALLRLTLGLSGLIEFCFAIAAAFFIPPALYKDLTILAVYENLLPYCAAASALGVLGLVAVAINSDVALSLGGLTHAWFNSCLAACFVRATFFKGQDNLMMRAGCATHCFMALLLWASWLLYHPRAAPGGKYAAMKTTKKN
eukprot:TRINITY_DN17625_c0_g1_i1.p3 TRINITY_DN17625_c0_g1~~TRINITY_DN17625_c0_g1_i1.p3  ORF type:complete len:151 (+),score=52.15 TRINITY_DN17625_c0_g1_i1:29-454(+)